MIFFTRMIYLRKTDLKQYFELDTNSENWATLKKSEFKNTVDHYTYDNILETLLFFVIFLRLSLNFVSKRIKNFLYYLSRSLVSVLRFTILIVFINLIFSSIGKNLFGTKYDAFENITSSFYNTLMLSIGK